MLLPMTADKAREVVATMNQKTKIDARIALYRAALGRHGNLSEEAKEVYRAALAKDEEAA
jgi:hypothetical protein